MEDQNPPTNDSLFQQAKMTQVWKPALSSSSMEDQNPPTNDSLYQQAKRAQLIERDPEKAIELFKSAIDSGDRVESALKDMVYVMKGLGRIDEAIEAIEKYWNLCSPQSEESLINVLINLNKQAGRIDEQIELLHQKIKLIEEGKAFGGLGTKTVKVGRRVRHIPVIQEKSRLLGNLARLYMQNRNYSIAEPVLREALSIELDKNKECNLAICLIYEGRVSEARFILEAVRHSSEVMGSSYVKSYNRACKVLMEHESQSVLNYPPPHYPPPYYFPHYPPSYYFPHYPPQPPPHHLPQHPQPSQPPPPHHLPQHPQPSQPPPPPRHLPQHPHHSQPPPLPPPPQHPPIFDVNPNVSPYDDFDISTFEGLEMLPWRRRGI